MTTLDSGYALAQLERALYTAATHADAGVRERARARVERWRNVIDGMASGTLAIGSRTPTSAPAWATLEVVHGGFATGGLSAEGPLVPHEQALALRLGATDRRAIALHYLSDAGREELRAMLASGAFAIDVPEEGAMLAVVALLARGATDRAADVVDAIAPYLGRLRFHPRPSERAIAPVSTVHVETIDATRARLPRLQTPRRIERMRDALTLWLPLTDRTVDLVLETFEGDAPCRVFPEGWRDRARALEDEYADVLRVARIRPRPKENLPILMAALARLVEPGSVLSPRELGRVRIAVLGHVRKHGAPGSERRRALREEQARVAAMPTRGASVAIVTARLAGLAGDGALSSLDAASAPMSPQEADSFGVPAGTPLWPSVAAKLQRCFDASIEELVERGVLTSGEAMARVLPQISSHVRALGFPDPEIARLYGAIDAAFRRRRSLLLLDYQSQAKLDELPWIAALEPFRTSDDTSRDAARRLFSSTASLAIASFPQAIVPNPLLNELRALAQRAEIYLPIVDELAADIFRGGFTVKFVRAAGIVADRLEGTLYARYYGLPIGEIRAMAAALPPRNDERDRLGGPVPAFGELCERMAGPATRRSVARNGTIIEQQQILTTQNLVPLIAAADLGAAIFPELARFTFEWICTRVQMRAPGHRDRLRTVKNAAYAWRQAIAYVSLSPRGTEAEFLAFARGHLAEQSEPFRSRFGPVVDGLEDAVRGRAPRARLLGWTTGEHPLLEA